MAEDKGLVRRWLGSTREQLFERIQFDLLTSALLLAVVLGAIAVELRPPTSGNAENWARYALLVLVILALSVHEWRYRLREQAGELTKAVASLQNAEAQLQTFLDLAQGGMLLIEEQHVAQGYLSNAALLKISGITLNRTIEDNLRPLEGVLSWGGTVEIMITDYSNHLDDEFRKRFRLLRGDAEGLRERLKRVHAHINDLADEAAGSGGILRVGHLPFFAPCGIIIVKPQSADVRNLRCEIYHRSSTEDQSAFYLSSSRREHAQFIDTYTETFNSYWDLCRKEVLVHPEHGRGNLTMSGGRRRATGAR